MYHARLAVFGKVGQRRSRQDGRCPAAGGMHLFVPLGERTDHDSTGADVVILFALSSLDIAAQRNPNGQMVDIVACQMPGGSDYAPRRRLVQPEYRLSHGEVPAGSAEVGTDARLDHDIVNVRERIAPDVEAVTHRQCVRVDDQALIQGRRPPHAPRTRKCHSACDSSRRLPGRSAGQRDCCSLRQYPLGVLVDGAGSLAGGIGEDRPAQAYPMNAKHVSAG